MADNINKELLTEYVDRLETTDLDIEEVREELRANGLQEDDISHAIEAIESEGMIRNRQRISYQKSAQMIVLGWLSTFAGAFITIGTLAGFVDLGSNLMIVYGPLLGGMSLILLGTMKRRRGKSKLP